ncbi:diheme cytochrome c [Acidovorax kalamii]|uniref:diheme cytochrome c n=1 Tax=Acidovorax kalamii TaxID=2004485 RepID=UPI0020901CF0|nr:diheme cytochrome c [Acidovorax kalamii]MCO5354921.1 diheme cytochrome c [Acidovorax kalamii]
MKKLAPVRPSAKAVALCMLALQTFSSAHADSGRAMPRNVPSAYAQECAACHTAYPPGLLPAASWNRVLMGLDKHYGTDASLDATTVRQLNQWLQAHAGTYKRVTEEPPEDRITRSAWFERKHRKIEPATWKLASVKSSANCAACHAGADQGQFDDHNLRMPAGLDARSRRAWND